MSEGEGESEARDGDGDRLAREGEAEGELEATTVLDGDDEADKVLEGVKDWGREAEGLREMERVCEGVMEGDPVIDDDRVPHEPNWKSKQSLHGAMLLPDRQVSVSKHQPQPSWAAQSKHEERAEHSGQHPAMMGGFAHARRTQRVDRGRDYWNKPWREVNLHPSSIEHPRTRQIEKMLHKPSKRTHQKYNVLEKTSLVDTTRTVPSLYCTRHRTPATRRSHRRSTPPPARPWWRRRCWL